MTDLLASAIVELSGSGPAVELRGTFFDESGNMLATVDEPGLSRWQRLYRAGHAFVYPKQGVRPLKHRLEVRGSDGQPLFSVIKNREFGFSRRRIRVLGSDGSLVGVAEQAWRNPIRGRFRMFDAHRGVLGELKPLGRPAMRYSVVDANGVTASEVSRIPVTLPHGGSSPTRCRVSFGDTTAPLRIVTLGCVIVLQLMF